MMFFMPLYEYQCTDQSGCSKCLSGLTRLEKIKDMPITQCPHCNASVRRVISVPHVQRGQAHLLSPKTVQQAGMTQYKKIGKGVYEKTAGRGPRIISDTQ